MNPQIMVNENGNVVDNIQTALWEPRISKSKAITTHIKVCTWWHEEYIFQ
jgi:hypothetical protein